MRVVKLILQVITLEIGQFSVDDCTVGISISALFYFLAAVISNTHSKGCVDVSIIVAGISYR